MYKLVLLRHGESVWNKENRFTGWTDVDLTEKGIEEAKKAGVFLKDAGFVFDIVFTSLLKRAIRTMELVLQEMDLKDVPVEYSWRLNERHYGALQGLNKSETTKKFGEEQVLKWRRSYDIRPPALVKDDPRYPGNDPIYRDLSESDLPLTECLKDTVDRFLPYWEEAILPRIKEGKNVLIVAHGNSLRALAKYLDNLTNEEVVDLNIPTGIPLVYELDENFHVIRHYYLGDAEEINAAQMSVKNQARA